MKKLILAGILLAPLFSSAQKVQAKEVPDAVKIAFARDHAGTQVKEWEKENNHYEAEYKKDGREYSVAYNVNGELIETEFEISPGELPESAAQYIEEHYQNTKVKEAAKITSPNGTITYEADLGKQDILFDSQGNFLGVEKETEDDED